MKRSLHLIYSFSLLLLLGFIILCEGVKPAAAKGKNVKNEVERNADSEDENGNNGNKLMEKLQPHFQQFGAPFQPLEHANDQILKRNCGASNKVEWRLMEVNKYKEIKEWTWEFSMLEEKLRAVEKRVLAPAMTDYANCIMKTKKMKNIIKEKKTAKIFLLNGGITILDMKPILGKRHAYRVKYEAEFSDNGNHMLEPFATHFCTALIVLEENIGPQQQQQPHKIEATELVCTRIGEWMGKENASLPKNIEKRPDCGYAELHDAQLSGDNLAVLLRGSAAENLLEFVQIKMALDLLKMIQNFAQHFAVAEQQKKSNYNHPEELAESTNEPGRIKTMDPNVCVYKEFLLEYDPKKLSANWLLERLTSENVSSKVMPTRRKTLKWTADPRLSRLFQPNEKDYKMAKQFKLNHGHLAGFRAHRANVDETFLFPNSVPQDREINSGYWRVIEEYALCLAGHKQSIVYIYTGPLYIPEEEEIWQHHQHVKKWQMSYKVVGESKMSVSTHLFKTIFVEFMTVDEKGLNKKDFWLESLVMSNGEDDEEEELEEREENVNDEQMEEENYSDGDELSLDEQQEKMEIAIETSKNDWHVLTQDEAEIDKILMEISSQKSQASKDEGKEKISAGTIKKAEKIQALVYGCQNRHYNIVYGDASSGDTIGKLLKKHRYSLEYIDKYAPQFRLLTKLPPQLRANTKGIYFDEQRIAELLEKNEENEKKKKGKAKILNEEETSNDEEENEEKSPRGMQKKSQQHGRKFVARGKGKKNKGGRGAKKQHKAEQKNHIDETILNFGASNKSDNGSIVINRLEETYKEYLFAPKKINQLEESRLWNEIHLQLRWIALLSLLQLVKEQMEDDQNTQGVAQIDAIQLEIIFQVEGKIISETKHFGDAFYRVEFCWLIHLRESFIRAFLPTPSTAENKYQKMSIGLKRIALDMEQKRWAKFGLYKNLSFASGDENNGTEFYSIDDDGKIIAQKLMKLADAHCRAHDDNNAVRLNAYVYKFKREIHTLNFVSMHKLLTNAKGKLAQKYANLPNNIVDRKEILQVASFKVMSLISVQHFKLFMKIFPKLVVIDSSEFDAYHSTIFHDAIFDLRLHNGYRQRKHWLLECLLFFDLYTVLDSIVANGEKYNERLNKEFGLQRQAKRDRKRELRAQLKKLHQQLEQCLNVEHQDTMVGQATVRACAMTLYCQMQNLFSEFNIKEKELMSGQDKIVGNLPYYNATECDQMMSFRNLRGKLLAELLRKDTYLSVAFYQEFTLTELRNAATRRLFTWAFDIIRMEQGEIVTEDFAKVNWTVSKPPNKNFAHRKQTLLANERMEAYIMKFRQLLFGNPEQWQTVQCLAALPLIQIKLSALFSNMPNAESTSASAADAETNQNNKNDDNKGIEQIAAGNSENAPIIKLNKIFLEMLNKTRENMNMNPKEEICKTLLLRNAAMDWLRTNLKKKGNGVGENEKLEEMLKEYQSGGEYLNAGDAGQPTTMESLNEYCQNEKNLQTLLRKHRTELELLMATELNSIFYTQAVAMSEYKIFSELPAKLIKMAGINGFMRIARNHPLVMSNVFDRATVQALLYQIHIHEEDEKEAEKASNSSRKNELKKEMMIGREKRKMLILLDLILYQFALLFPGKIDNEERNTETPEEMELRFRIERAQSAGTDLMDEWLDNSEDLVTAGEKKNEEEANEGGEMDKYNVDGMTKEQREEAAENVDQRAYLEIGRLIRENDRVALEQELGIDSKEIVDGEEVWRKRWRNKIIAEIIVEFELNEWVKEGKAGENEDHQEDKAKNEVEEEVLKKDQAKGKKILHEEEINKEQEKEWNTKNISATSSSTASKY